MSGPRERVLVYRAIGLGDLLAGVPALRALRRALPRHEIVLAAPAAQAPLIELAGVVDRLIPTAELEPVRWSGPPPEIGIDLHGNGPASRELVAELRPRRLIAFGAPDCPHWDPEEHERVRWCRLIACTLGYLGGADDVSLERPDRLSPAPGCVVVHPGAASGSRRWPAHRFAAVARRLADRGHRVVVTGSAAEIPLAELVRRQARLPEEAMLAGRTELIELAALVADARLVVCGDTGIAHLASAYATPSVVLFGPIPPALWGPPAGPHVPLWHGQRLGDPHGATTDPALLHITVDEVSEAAEALLATHLLIDTAPLAPLTRRAAPPSTAPSA